MQPDSVQNQDVIFKIENPFDANIGLLLIPGAIRRPYIINSAFAPLLFFGPVFHRVQVESRVPNVVIKGRRVEHSPLVQLGRLFTAALDNDA